jgi:hypothetical protein
MKLGSGIPKHSIKNLKDNNFHVYNSLILKDDLAFQRTYFRTTPTNIPRLYQHDVASDEQDDLSLQNRSTIQNNELLKIAVIITTDTCTKEAARAIIDSGASCCVKPYIEDFIHQPTPIQNTTLNSISGGLTALCRGTVQIRINQENKENIILIIYKCDIRRTRLPHPTNHPATITQTIQSKSTRELLLRNRRKYSNTFHGGGGVRLHAITTLKQKYQHYAA